jgi:hypothetical protein
MGEKDENGESGGNDNSSNGGRLNHGPVTMMMDARS